MNFAELKIVNAHSPQVFFSTDTGSLPDSENQNHTSQHRFEIKSWKNITAVFRREGCRVKLISSFHESKF